MRKQYLLISVLLTAALFVALSQNSKQQNNDGISEYLSADKYYHDAEQIALSDDYDESKENQLNEKALAGFRIAAPLLKSNKLDSFAFQCYFRIGVLEHYFERYPQAQQAYQQAIRSFASISNKTDSLLFKPYLYSGIVYYYQNQFDSAVMQYKHAEQIADAYGPKLTETERLYNNLGALYYENGNYKQAGNYFGKAISTLSASHPYYKNLLVNFKINQASALSKLESYNEADSIYRSVLSYDLNNDEIKHNIGSIELELKRPEEALRYFRQVNYTDNKIIWLLNDMGRAFLETDRHDSALFYLNRASSENERWNKKQKNLQHGLTLKYLGDLYAHKKDLRKAADYYQQAIIELDYNFSDRSLSSNPQQFTGIFSYINLFNTLSAKGEILEALFSSEKEQSYLEDALKAYESAFALSDYVEQSYDSDEARLFLNKIRYNAHDKPIHIAIYLYKLTGKISYLNKAFEFDQRNKASILSLNISDALLRNKAGIDGSLLKEEAAVKTNITRLSIKKTRLTDSKQIEETDHAIRDLQISLGKLQEKINRDPVLKELRAGSKSLNAEEVRSVLDNKTCLLSYHLSASNLVIFAITKKGLSYSVSTINDSFFQQLDSLRNSLHDISGTEKYQHELAGKLYEKLIAPVKEIISSKERLIIIPDDELNYIPFEALESSGKHFLLEDISIQYIYSTSLLLSSKQLPDKTLSTLAMAPFSTKSYGELSQLVGSGAEVSGLNGKTLSGKDASKENFLSLANNYDIIHLATHASVSDSGSSMPVIYFSPENHQEPRLYAEEIADLRLDSTRLVILSACETGNGKLVKGEGLMSLSRAFAYAGCNNIITSLWKADDLTTSFISKRLHYYINDGLRYDMALQKAKIDLLNSRSIPPRYKTPNYWAHLVFIGNYAPANTFNWYWVIIPLSALLIFFILKARIKRTRP